ncbi:hypothetical protein F5878DRAFT_723861 [Lentinula raphanica]|uniref:F-box domain-containing protein n=1 Tax=Lentinula raphanica TaxID=153919 RepID=A0AA38PCV8_9AGAR|nr:hypothetical protein F5878DRAFT_723861 [Lentinula raphanica]
MGADGYHVYRYKGYFFIWYTRYDSYIQNLGRLMADEIPRDPVRFEAYVSSKKAELQQILDSQSDSAEKSDSDELDEDWQHVEDSQEEDSSGGLKLSTYLFKFELCRKPPKYGFLKYEIDLDNFIFYFQGEPMFDIRNMPDREHFLTYLNEFCHTSELPEIPEIHSYKIPPPDVGSDWIDAYKCFNARCTDIHNVLGAKPQMNRFETTCMKIMEMCTVASMSYMQNSYGLGINALLLNYVPYRVIRRLHNLCDLFSGPLVFDASFFFYKWKTSQLVSKDYLRPPSYDIGLFYWFHEESLCMLAVNRLDTEEILQAEIVSLSDEVIAFYKDKEHVNSSIFYGVILSLYDVCIVRLRVVDHEGKRTVQVESHTPALQFLPRITGPSGSITNTYTPGIEALSRLGNLMWQNHLQKRLINERKQTHELFARSGCRLLPAEICLNIAQYLTHENITVIASVSLQWAHVAVEMLQHPYFMVNSPYPRSPYCYRVLPTIRQRRQCYPITFDAHDMVGRDRTIHLTTIATTSTTHRLQETYRLGDGIRVEDYEECCRIRVFVENLKK